MDLGHADEDEAVAQMALQEWAPDGGSLELWRDGLCVLVGYLTVEPAEEPALVH